MPEPHYEILAGLQAIAADLRAMKPVMAAIRGQLTAIEGHRDAIDDRLTRLGGDLGDIRRHLDANGPPACGQPQS